MMMLMQLIPMPVLIPVKMQDAEMDTCKHEKSVMMETIQIMMLVPICVL